MTVESAFLGYSVRKLAQLSERIEDCLCRLTLEQIWRRSGDSDNAVGNLVLHLCGNVSQWIGHGVAGRPDARDRDAEFAARGGVDAAALQAVLRDAVNEANRIVSALSHERLAESIEVQGYQVTVLEAVFHVVEHFSGHTGQIQFAAKLMTGDDLGYYKHLATDARREQVP